MAIHVPGSCCWTFGLPGLPQVAEGYAGEVAGGLYVRVDDIVELLGYPDIACAERARKHVSPVTMLVGVGVRMPMCCRVAHHLYTPLHITYRGSVWCAGGQSLLQGGRGACSTAHFLACGDRRGHCHGCCGGEH